MRPPGEARDAARRVLSRPEYRRPAPTLAERVRNWVADRLAEIVGALVTGRRASLLAWAVLGAGVALAAFFGFRFVRGVTPDSARAVSDRPAPRKTAAEWRRESEAHEQAGQWRMVLRCLYRALVADLADRGLVEEVPGRTTGEYRSEVGQMLPAAAAEFAGATELFERAWYGNQPTGADEAERLRRLSETVLSRAAA